MTPYNGNVVHGWWTVQILTGVTNLLCLIDFEAEAECAPEDENVSERVINMEVLYRGASFELGGMKQRSIRVWGLIGGFGF